MDYLRHHRGDPVGYDFSSYVFETYVIFRLVIANIWSVAGVGEER